MSMLAIRLMLVLRRSGRTTSPMRMGALTIRPRMRSMAWAWRVSGMASDVRTAEAIPLALHAQAMDLIRGLVVNAPIRMGDVVLPNLLDTGTDLIASMDIDPAEAAN